VVVAQDTGKLNKIEKLKAEKDGLAVKAELETLAAMGWENVPEGDREVRLKWLGLFFRPVTPGLFMLRLRVPGGILTATQMQTLAAIVERCGEHGSADITTRQNLQLRGIRLEDFPGIFRQLREVGMTCVQSGMDNVRNLTASPMAGLDADELYDTRPLLQELQDALTNGGEGNPEFSNLPRKFNIAIDGSRENSVHAEINDIAYVPAFRDGVFGFNVLVGGFFSGTRVAAAVPLDAWVLPAQVIELSLTILRVYRDNGARASRQKARLMWLLDDWGVPKFREAVAALLTFPLLPAALEDEYRWERRDFIGVFPQKQSGWHCVGLHVPAGRLTAEDMYGLARIAQVYGSGELRLTVEQNVLVPNVPGDRLEILPQEPLLQKFSWNPPPLQRGVVSCTGAKYCGFALIETKARAVAIAAELDRTIAVPKPVRMHWTGCPNSCGQPQVADIGLMGAKARKDGKVVEGVNIYLGGQVGPNAHLGECVAKAVPCDDLIPILQDLLVRCFGGQPKPGVVLTPPALVVMPPTPHQPTVAEPEAPVPARKVIFGRSGKEVLWEGRLSLLELAEKAGLEAPSDCRSGNCGTCKQRLTAGQVTYFQEPNALREEEQAAGFVLTCSSHPATPTVQLDW